MKILITGCAGFIGFHLVNFLVKKNYNVFGCDNLSSFSKKTQELRINQLKKLKKFNFKKIDLINEKSLKAIYKNIKFDFVIHLAAQPGVRLSIKEPQRTIDNNIKVFINILEFCKNKKIKKIFYASSSSIYGNTLNFKEDAVSQNTTSLYAATKLCNEIIAKYYFNLFKINSIGLRFFTVYGEYGREDMAYYKFLTEIKNNRRIVIFGDKNSKRSFTYIQDVITAINKLLIFYNNKKIFCKNFNIGSSKNYTLKKLINIIKENFSESFLEIYKPRNNADVFVTKSYNKNLEKIIGYKLETSLENGMTKFIKWFKKNDKNLI